MAPGARGPRRIPRSFLVRAAYSLAVVVIVVISGTLAMHEIEGWSLLDSFYFTSFVATGQGPPANLDPTSAVGKITASILAFVSVGTVISALLFLFGPFFGRVFRAEVEKLEDVEKRREDKRAESQGKTG